MIVPAHTNTTTTAAEVLAAHTVWGTSGFGIETVRCSCKGPWMPAADFPQHQADMLAAAGLLADPTARTEWGVACDIHDEVSEAEDREDAERIKAHHDAGMDHGHTIVRRTVTAWTVAGAPAADDEGGQER